ncbi:hypothetical protein C0J52_07975 [Blattella germanica]|nr:hypothetical protein C0J52_07975 [Blattella germanica]
MHGGEVDSFLGQNPPSASPAPDFQQVLPAPAEPKLYAPTSFNQGLVSSKPPLGFAPQPFSSPSFQQNYENTSLPVLQVAPVTSTVFSTNSQVKSKSEHDLPTPQYGLAETTPASSVGIGDVTSQLSSVSLSQAAAVFPPSQELNVTKQVDHVSAPAVLPAPPITPLSELSNSYRLRNQRKPLYAQPPGIGASSVSPAVPNLYSAPPVIAMETTQTPATLPYKSADTPDKQPDLSLAFANQGPLTTMYRPVYHHWFFKKEVESKVVWPKILPETVVSTDGGRYDVNILRRQRLAVYWQENPTEVRRCSWFYKGSSDTRYVPYEENVSTRLEEEFKVATTTNVWHRRVELPNGEAIVFHGPTVMVHYLQATSPDAWGNSPQTQLRPRIVKRGVDEFDIDEGEPTKVDHLLFLVHGIGSVCDLKFRTVEEVVDDFRNISLQLVQSHFRTAMDEGKVNRIEVLPISWHATLHGEDTGIDRKLKSITLNSIPKLRHFTNDTLLDILFYTSPVYCQDDLTEKDADNAPPPENKSNQKVGYVMGNAGTGQPFITYPQLIFQPSMFVTVRGIDTLGEDFKLPTCPGFFNIFHPYDPVAYRIETLVNPGLTDLRPVLIPHHKGRKRMHLELKETMARVGADLKQKLVESVRNTWNTVYQLAMFHRSDDVLQQEVDKVLEEQMHQQSDADSSQGTEGEVDEDVCIGQLNGGRRIDYVLQEAPLESFNEYIFAMKTHVCYWESEDTMLMILKEVYSTMGISVDKSSVQSNLSSSSSANHSSGFYSGSEAFVPTSASFTPSQEQVSTFPVEMQSSPLLSMSSPSGAVSQPYPKPPSTGENMPVMGMDPTAPLMENRNIGPPPMAGFVRKSKS